jgi:hypothetical protein
MERSAASILDWAHYQAYAIDFPIRRTPETSLGAFKGLELSRVSEHFPAYALSLESDNADLIADVLMETLRILKSGNPHGERIPVNLIWKKTRVWIVPRARGQSELAAKYFGGLEMGGIFCLPNADDLRRYLPSALKMEINTATLACEPETREWFEENLLRICESIQIQTYY